MIPTTKLLTTVCLGSLTSYVCRYVHIGTINQKSKILHMSEIPVKHLLLGNLRKCASVPEALYSTCLSLLKSENTKKRGSKETVMEPFLEMCLAQTDTSTCGTNFVQNKNNPYGMSKKRYKGIRQWKMTDEGSMCINAETDFALRLLTYNILAQNLLETHSYLYKHHNSDALGWKCRKPLVQQEIIDANANVICIQEMQKEHLQDFLVPFREVGYDYLYKKRTNDTKDGLLLLYRPSQFKLEDYVLVEFHQTSEDILNRDNVAIVAKFSLKESPETHIVIATTHLLYNPNRNDVRLAQTQILLAEIERIAFIGNTASGPQYHPTIVCGDFNLQPLSGVYKFITEGSFRYLGKGRSLGDNGFRRLSNTLIPTSLLVTDNCQHFNILTKRIRGIGDENIMLENSESKQKRGKSRKSSPTTPPISEVNFGSSDCQKIEIASGKFATFSSGSLSHPFNFSSVYKHANDAGEPEATTHQLEWITVDYIFHSQLEVIDRYILPTVGECEELPMIPNFAVGSDHLCLGATFRLKKISSVR